MLFDARQALSVTPLAVTPGTPLELALSVVASDPLIADVLTQAQALGFAFVVQAPAVQASETRGTSMGLAIGHDRSPSPRTGAQLFATVNLVERQVIAAQLLIGSCLDTLLMVTALAWDGRPQKVYEEFRSPLLPTRAPPRRLHPRIEQGWALPRDAGPWAPPSPRVMQGWPDPSTDSTLRWQYQGADQLGWGPLDADVAICRCPFVQEVLLQDPPQLRRVTLDNVRP